MTEAEIAAALDRATAALDAGEGIAGTGFNQAIAAVKRSPELADRFADRIGEIDRRRFREWAALTIPYPVGLALIAAGVAAGTTAVAYSSRLRGPAQGLVFGVGTAAVLVATHPTAHLVTGRAMGMEFTEWFIGKPTQPQPGIKIDYATYLRTPARQRAWMHASGALLTKLLAFAAIPAARITRQPRWVRRLVTLFALGSVVTDAVWSVRQSDWKKFRREMRYAD